jgi:hypothetical protein
LNAIDHFVMAITARLRLGSDNPCQRRNSAACQTKEDIMSGTSEIRTLTSDEIDAVTGGDCYNHQLSYNGVTLVWGQCDNSGAQFGVFYKDGNGQTQGVVIGKGHPA